MNKSIPTNERLFMAIVGPSGCGKSHLIEQFFVHKIFEPIFDKVYFFYQHYQRGLNDRLPKLVNVEFIAGVNYELIDSLPNDGTKYLLIFDDSCDEICSSKQFQKIATAGRHRNLSVIYIKHNLFHQGSLGRDIELQNTHIVLFKSPRDVQQVRILSRQLGLGSELEQWYKLAISKPYGHLMIDLHPKTVDCLRFSSGFEPTRFHLPKSQSRVTFVNDEYTKLLYS